MSDIPTNVQIHKTRWKCYCFFSIPFLLQNVVWDLPVFCTKNKSKNGKRAGGSSQFSKTAPFCLPCVNFSIIISSSGTTANKSTFLFFCICSKWNDTCVSCMLYSFREYETHKNTVIQSQVALFCSKQHSVWPSIYISPISIIWKHDIRNDDIHAMQFFLCFANPKTIRTWFPTKQPDTTNKTGTKLNKCRGMRATEKGRRSRSKNR